MDLFLDAFLIPVAVIWGAFVLLLIYARKKSLFFSRREKRQFIIILITFITVSGCFFFFKDAGFVFVCQKSTQRCDYFHSTLYNKQIRPVRSYDLTGITRTEIVSHRRSCGRYCRKTVYRIRFQGNGDGFEMPKDIDFAEDAREQAAKASAFIQTGKAAYIYKDIMPDGAEKDLMFVMVAAMSMLFASVGIFSLLAKLFKKNVFSLKSRT